MNESMKKKLAALSQMALVGTLVFQVAHADAASDTAQAVAPATQSAQATAAATSAPGATSGGGLAASIVQAQAAKDADAAAQKAMQDAATSRFEQALAVRQSDWSPLPASDKRTLTWKEVKSNINLKPEMVAVGADSLWAVEKGRIYRHAKNEWKPCGLGVYVAVGADGTVVSINEKNDVFVHQGGDTWLQIKDLELTEVSVQDAKNMIGLLTNKDGSAKVMECVNGEWSEALNMLKNPAGGLKDVDLNKLGFALGITPNGTPVALSHETKAFLEEHSEEVVTRVTKVRQRKGHKASHKGAGKGKAATKSNSLKAGAGKHRHAGKGKGNGLKARMNAIKKQNKKTERKLAKAKAAAPAEAADHDAADANNNDAAANSGK